ncbi:hypothetical protein [Bacteroides sp.]|uniref:hypothetical protein n=1 Tax=Bacteroides sp. TaxID=29523 RepID=UPI0026233BA8|nr:hypothetical protein [Bacteroides sp.]MDD3040137.1 hypothetical protein [Bacteroides sp.]
MRSKEAHNCPCSMKIDMELSENVYEFLVVYFPELDSEKDWKNLLDKNLECSFCLLNAALKIAKRSKYNPEITLKLARSKCIVTRMYYTRIVLKFFRRRTD